ncbi:hypothetical protein B0T17DRAFT_331686 [Bombardia bombarda]|uniref:Uncharacterized protein n=1 Tax=Bombardia bombarda TaxID=252184 RepID=A0AA39WMQ9_9PEZI|nr:hypothetical protein B0T17DRAFT_331686 [Bombardia bombarda]
MFSTTSPLFCALALLSGLVAAAPRPQGDCEKPRTICFDTVNACGVKWGACYDKCKPSEKPLGPYCVPPTPTSASATSTPVTVTLTTSVSGPSTVTAPPNTSVTGSGCGTSAGSGATICWDGINSCGMTYGGCFADCRPWPTFTPPACVTKTGGIPAPSIPTPTLVSAYV